MEADVIERRDWNSHLDVAQKVLTLRVKAHMTPAPAGTHSFTGNNDAARTMTVSAPSLDELESLRTDFANTISRYWNDKLVLRTLRNIMTPQVEVACAVEFEWVARADAQLVIQMFLNPEGVHASEFRQSCAAGGRSGLLEEWTGDDNPIDMRLKNVGLTSLTNRRRWTTDHDWQTFQQNSASHEFGHYLGNHHSCADWRQPWNRNDPVEYCGGRSRWQQLDMMAVGTEVRRTHADAWLDRMRDHEYLVGRRWDSFRAGT